MKINNIINLEDKATQITTILNIETFNDIIEAQINGEKYNDIEDYTKASCDKIRKYMLSGNFYDDIMSCIYNSICSNNCEYSYCTDKSKFGFEYDIDISVLTVEKYRSKLEKDICASYARWAYMQSPEKFVNSVLCNNDWYVAFQNIESTENQVIVKLKLFVFSGPFFDLLSNLYSVRHI